MAYKEASREPRFVTIQGRVLAYIEQHPKETARQIAIALEITDRTGLGIIAQLRHHGYLVTMKTGRTMRKRPLGHAALREALQVIVAANGN